MLNERPNLLQHQGFGVRYSKLKKRKMNIEYWILNIECWMKDQIYFNIRCSVFDIQNSKKGKMNIEYWILNIKYWF